MSEPDLEAMRALIQQDVGERGLASNPGENLFTVCQGDFSRACRALAQARGVLIVTGFPIVAATPVCGETDGPPGAIALARSLVHVGIEAAIAAVPCSHHALEAGLKRAGLEDAVALRKLPPGEESFSLAGISHLVAIECVGPGHTLESLRAQTGTCEIDIVRFEREMPAGERDRCRSMRGVDVTGWTSPWAWRIFEEAARQSPALVTIGIGDGGNEIGMGKLPWRVIQDNVALGGRIACRVATDHLIVCGVSNWGAYALGAGVSGLRGVGWRVDLEAERAILQEMVEQGPLVDGRTMQRAVSVDGLTWERYARVLADLQEAAQKSMSGSPPGHGESRT